ncbi:MAG: hypothetical protein M3040_12200 [Bacteroidota bacterium]|nr:hypothetical protein [Bacteroidota bacterium]
MANDDKLQQQKNSAANAERDQDEGNMNNGTLGGNMGVIGSSNPDEQANNDTESQATDTPAVDNKKG